MHDAWWCAGRDDRRGGGFSHREGDGYGRPERSSDDTNWRELAKKAQEERAAEAPEKNYERDQERKDDRCVAHLSPQWSSPPWPCVHPATKRSEHHGRPAKRPAAREPATLGLTEEEERAREEKKKALEEKRNKGASPFGEAKPRDELSAQKKLQEIEERRKQAEEEKKKKQLEEDEKRKKRKEEEEEERQKAAKSRSPESGETKNTNWRDAPASKGGKVSSPAHSHPPSTSPHLLCSPLLVEVPGIHRSRKGASQREKKAAGKPSTRPLLLLLLDAHHRNPPGEELTVLPQGKSQKPNPATNPQGRTHQLPQHLLQLRPPRPSQQHQQPRCAACFLLPLLEKWFTLLVVIHRRGWPRKAHQPMHSTCLARPRHKVSAIFWTWMHVPHQEVGVGVGNWGGKCVSSFWTMKGVNFLSLELTTLGRHVHREDPSDWHRWEPVWGKRSRAPLACICTKAVTRLSHPWPSSRGGSPWWFLFD